MVLCVSYIYRNEDSLRVEPTQMQHVLKQHFSHVINEVTPQRLNVRHQELLADTFRQFKWSNFDTTKLIRVMFLSESAIDGGGPCREFFVYC